MLNPKKLFENRFIISELIRKKIKTQYRNSALGMLWTVLNPLLTMLVMWIIFTQFFGADDPYYAIYLLTGTIMFSCLRFGTEGALTSIVEHRNLLTRTKIDSYLFPLSSTLASVVNLAFSMISLLLIMLGMQIFGGHNLFSYRILFVILMIPAFWMFQLGIGLFLSSLFVFLRDVLHLYSIFLTLWTYITPIFYKTDALAPNSFTMNVIHLNPMYFFVTYFRDCMYSLQVSAGGLPSFGTLGLLYFFGILSVIIGTVTFKLTKKRFITYI